MSNLANAIKQIYPTIDLETQCIIQDDGSGAYIAQWNDSRPQPSQSELQTAELAYSKAQKIEDLKQACTTAIQAGFTSSALGEAHTYDSTLPQDQTNLLGAKIAGIDMYFTCTDSSGYKSQKFHTVAQMAQVYQAGMVHLQTAKARYHTRKIAVEQAQTIEAVDAVVW